LDGSTAECLPNRIKDPADSSFFESVPTLANRSRTLISALLFFSSEAVCPDKLDESDLSQAMTQHKRHAVSKFLAHSVALALLVAGLASIFESHGTRLWVLDNAPHDVSFHLNLLAKVEASE